MNTLRGVMATPYKAILPQLKKLGALLSKCFQITKIHIVAALGIVLALGALIVGLCSVYYDKKTYDMSSASFNAEMRDTERVTKVSSLALDDILPDTQMQFSEVSPEFEEPSTSQGVY